MSASGSVPRICAGPRISFRIVGMAAALKRRAELYRQGRDLRARVPRETHAQLRGPPGPGRGRRSPAKSDAERVPEFVPKHYGMMADPFGFLRGGAAVMATDLAHEPLAGVPVQACRDCHLIESFGAFNSPEDNILFDINDFDETLPGDDFTVDLKRLAASVAVAAKAAAMSDKRARSLAASTVTASGEHMFALMDLSPRRSGTAGSIFKSS